MAWKVSGQYYETCSCEFVCPCVTGQMAVSPSKGSCTFAMAFQIDDGNYGNVPLNGLGFIVLGLTPEAMGKGNWSVGLIADQRASVVAGIGIDLDRRRGAGRDAVIARPGIQPFHMDGAEMEAGWEGTNLN